MDASGFYCIFKTGYPWVCTHIHIIYCKIIVVCVLYLSGPYQQNELYASRRMLSHLIFSAFFSKKRKLKLK